MEPKKHLSQDPPIFNPKINKYHELPFLILILIFILAQLVIFYFGLPLVMPAKGDTQLMNQSIITFQPL